MIWPRYYRFNSPPWGGRLAYCKARGGNLKSMVKTDFIGENVASHWVIPPIWIFPLRGLRGGKTQICGRETNYACENVYWFDEDEDKTKSDHWIMIQMNSPTQPVTFFILTKENLSASGGDLLMSWPKVMDLYHMSTYFRTRHSWGGKPCLLARLGVEPLDLWMRWLDSTSLGTTWRT